MNIENLKFNINSWKVISAFPKYKELVKEAKKYYNNSLIFCFASKNKDIYIIKFEYKNDESFDLDYGYFSDLLKDCYPPHIEFKEYFPNIRKYNFNKTIQEVFNLYKSYENELIYYTHISNIYKIIINSINL